MEIIKTVTIFRNIHKNVIEIEINKKLLTLIFTFTNNKNEKLKFNNEGDNNIIVIPNINQLEPKRKGIIPKVEIKPHKQCGDFLGNITIYFEGLRLVNEYALTIKIVFNKQK